MDTKGYTTDENVQIGALVDWKLIVNVNVNGYMDGSTMYDLNYSLYDLNYSLYELNYNLYELNYSLYDLNYSLYDLN